MNSDGTLKSTGSIDTSISNERVVPLPTFSIEIVTRGKMFKPANMLHTLSNTNWVSK